jgi:transcription factor Dp-1
VADELVAEFADPNSNIGSPDPDNPNTVKNYGYSL